jgi:hypothetical protein
MQMVQEFFLNYSSIEFDEKFIFSLNLISHEISQLKKVFKLLLSIYSKHIFISLGQDNLDSNSFTKNHYDFEFFVFNLIKEKKLFFNDQIDKNQKFANVLENLVNKKFAQLDKICSSINEILVLVYN